MVIFSDDYCHNDFINFAGHFQDQLLLEKEYCFPDGYAGANPPQTHLI